MVIDIVLPAMLCPVTPVNLRLLAVNLCKHTGSGWEIEHRSQLL